MTTPHDPDADEALRALFALLEADSATSLPASSPVPAAPASGPIESVAIRESLERLVAAEAPDAGADPRASGTELLAAADDLADEPAPASSRRPVLPDDVAPALPDLHWDHAPLDTSEADAPPESGPHASAVDAEVDLHEVTGVRSAAVFASPDALGTRELAAAFELPPPETFAALLDEALAL